MNFYWLFLTHDVRPASINKPAYEFIVLSSTWKAQAEARLRIRTVLPEPSLFALMKYGSAQRVRPKNLRFSPTG